MRPCYVHYFGRQQAAEDLAKVAEAPLPPLPAPTLMHVVHEQKRAWQFG